MNQRRNQRRNTKYSDTKKNRKQTSKIIEGSKINAKRKYI